MFAASKKGIAMKPSEEAKAKLIREKVEALLVDGNPQYYGRYGFEADLGKHFIPPYVALWLCG